MKVPHDQTRNVSTKHLPSTMHSLPVRRRIDFKIAVLTYKLLSTDQPSCLACKITPYVSGCRLRSSESGTLTVPRIQTVIGSCAFRSAASSVWNLIPVDIRTAPSLESFLDSLFSACLLLATTKFNAALPYCHVVSTLNHVTTLTNYQHNQSGTVTTRLQIRVL